jgi:hydroxymethylpyrimidine pyrophosphatase-like HAD family hydrolase
VRYLALACDYDGTLAWNGRVTEETVEAVDRLLASGRKLILVTGRELDDLISVFPRLDLCEWVVAENGALLYKPSTREKKWIGEPAPEALVQQLEARGVRPLSQGGVIVATREPHETTVLEVIRDLGLERQVIFNKGAVMILPSGVNKATGLGVALVDLGISPHNIAGIGDAENDHAFLAICECSAAVANALPMVKERVDVVTRADHGKGVAELIDQLVQEDLRSVESRLSRHHILVGTSTKNEDVTIKPYGVNLLLAGPSEGGKSTMATGLLERIAEHGYQFCVIDPEGDYGALEGALVLGDSRRAPGIEEVLQLLKSPSTSVVVNLVGLAHSDRPAYFLALLSRLQEIRSRLGRPHWLVVDETHHVLPSSWDPAALALPQQLNQLIFITVHPSQIAKAVLSAVDIVLAVGQTARATLHETAEVLGMEAALLRDLPSSIEPGEALFWSRRGESGPLQVRIAPARAERRRHRRKYAEGDLGPERSFYFRGPEGKLNLRAQNLILFLQLAEGVDDETWTYHLRQRDFSQWFKEFIKDGDLAAEAAYIENQADLSPEESRRRIKEIIEQRYTLPASAAARVGPVSAAKER